jgi:hypothetical protein
MKKLLFAGFIGAALALVCGYWYCLFTAKPTAVVLEPENDFEFRYVGKEEFSNVFAVYRFDKKSGEIVRYTYSYYSLTNESPVQEIKEIRYSDGKFRRTVIDTYSSPYPEYNPDLFFKSEDWQAAVGDSGKMSDALLDLFKRYAAQKEDRFVEYLRLSHADKCKLWNSFAIQMKDKYPDSFGGVLPSYEVPPEWHETTPVDPDNDPELLGLEEIKLNE